MSSPSHAEAVAPERTRWVECGDVRLRAYEWGDPEAQPILLCHGFFDHGRGFDLLAPLLAERYFVTSIDSRGHGESEWADTYLWPQDVADVVRVMRDIGRPVHLVGHSKGGGQATDAALMEPEGVRGLVNLDGFGPPDDAGFQRPDGPDVSEMSIAERCGLFLDRRRKADRRVAWPAYPSFEELVARRAEQNPNLAQDWLRYFVFHAAKEVDEGWIWKADPQMVAGGFGPFRPDWIAPSWQHLRAPMLAVVGSVQDTWGPIPEDTLSERLSYVPQLKRATIEGSGHFLHMEKPAEIAQVVFEFLGEVEDGMEFSADRADEDGLLAARRHDPGGTSDAE